MGYRYRDVLIIKISLIIVLGIGIRMSTNILLIHLYGPCFIITAFISASCLIIVVYITNRLNGIDNKPKSLAISFLTIFCICLVIMLLFNLFYLYVLLFYPFTVWTLEPNIDPFPKGNPLDNRSGGGSGPSGPSGPNNPNNLNLAAGEQVNIRPIAEDDREQENAYNRREEAKLNLQIADQMYIEDNTITDRHLGNINQPS